MNTLPANRTLNTFNGDNNNNTRRSSISAIRYARSTSLYFPNTDTDEESRSQLLTTSESIAETRRAETMNRLNRIETRSEERSRNLTNPLFDSMGSLDQPWSRGYGQTVVLSPPKINLPIQQQQQQSHQLQHSYSHQQPSAEQDTASTVQDIQHSIRLPVRRSPNIMHGGYCALPPMHYGTSPRNGYGGSSSAGGIGVDIGGSGIGGGRKKTKKKTCLPCLQGSDKMESPANFYSSTDDLGLIDDLNKSDGHEMNNREHLQQQQQQQPYIICLSIVFALLDILLLIGLTLLIFFFNCSNDGWLYSDPRIRSICVTLWADWIPLYQRKFQCPDLPPGFLDNIISNSLTSNVGNGISSIIESNPELKPLLERMNILNNRQPVASSSFSTLTTPNPLSQLPRYQSNWISEKKRVNPAYWDGDLGLMLPPKLLIPPAEQHLYGPRDTIKLYGRNYPTDKEFIQGLRNDPWLQLSASQTDIYRHMSISSIITGSIIVPLIIDFCHREHEYFTSSHIIFNRLQGLKKNTDLLPEVVCHVTYIFGLLTTMLLVWLIKITVGRLRPDFIQICRPFENVCPNWYTILQKTRQSIDERNSIESDPRLLDLIVAQLAKQGKYLVTVATTLSPDSKSTGQLSDGLLTNANCMENNILKLKEARTSFPSLGAAVSMYAAIFVSVYITAIMKHFRDSCLCLPFLSLLGVSLVALLIGINRVIYRDNWFEDILAGWIVGICVAIYVCFKVLYNRDKWNDLTNYDLNRRLHRIQSLIQTHYDYKQSE
ncbi:phospholipid phosphatase-related type 5-like isoform X1, partial [Schistosoma japonicum]